MNFRRRPLFVVPPGAKVPDWAKPRRYTGLGSSQALDRAGFPLPSGAPGSGVDPYNETEVWGGQPGAQVTAPVDLSAPLPLPPPDVTGADGLSVPFGQSKTAWHNPNTFQSVPILASTPTNVPVLSLNLARSALIIQNGSTATAPDVAPILYVGFNSQPIIGFSLGVAVNLIAAFFDIICPRDSIFIAFGPSVNGGSTVVVRGCVVQATYIPT